MIELDKSLFLFLNSFNSPFWDSVMWIVSARLTWVPLYLAIIIMLGYKERKKLLVILPFLILTVVLTDQVTLHCFKNIFERFRPCYEPSLDGLVHIVNGKCGGKFGFVSSHASNTFGIATMSLLLMRHNWFSVLILLWASFVSYSRIYLGVHYPGDILGGALLGIFSGYLMYRIYRFVENNYLNTSDFFKKEGL
ncbi:MAG: phosphatase PAP2 family protein [Bacteroidales bacterium]|nr:phosphatase PAP2 family protein [Bacteroidales bacterium]